MLKSLVVFFFSLSASADLESQLMYSYKNWFLSVQERLQANPLVLTAQCADFHRDLYKSDILDIVMVGGYSEEDEGVDEGLVVDGPLTAALKTHLLQPCASSHYAACGFTESADGSPYLWKRIKTPQGEERWARMRIEHSSWSVEDQKNIQTQNRELQQQQTQLAQRTFVQGLQSAQVVIYDGHSRDGGGPDFAPPRRKPSGGVDYAWYQKNRPGLRLTQEALVQSVQKPVVLAVLSCLSSSHFVNSLHKVSPATTFVTTTSLVPSSSTSSAGLVVLNGILSGSCPSEWRPFLSPYKTQVIP